jgi:NAD(P)-dependent dehydrogenase (short-subunit alcohol dehydrogenase family)
MTEKHEFNDKVALVAGASSGINLAIARHLASLGVRVGLLSRDPKRIEAAAASIRDAGGVAQGFAADVRNYEDVAKGIEVTKSKFGPIDIVVSGAAGNFLAPAQELSSNGFRTVVEIDLIGTFNVYRAALEALNSAGASLIAITAPQASRPFVQQAHACAAKAGVNMLTRVLALEWASLGHRVNAISPGPIGDTEGVKRLWASNAAAKRLLEEVPLGRLGSFEDVAEAAAYLASSASRYVTGTILDVDGGYVWGASASSMKGAS